MIVDRKVNQLVIFVLGSAQPLLDWDRRARIQFGQVYFGVFTTSRFVVGPKWPSWYILRKWSFLDALASLDFKLSVSEWFTVFTASASTGLSELFVTFYNKHSLHTTSGFNGLHELLHSMHTWALTLIQDREMCCKILIQVTKKLSFKNCHGWNCRRPDSSRPMGASFKTQNCDERRMSYRKGRCFRITAIIFSENIDAYNDAGNGGDGGT